MLEHLFAHSVAPAVQGHCVDPPALSVQLRGLDVPLHLSLLILQQPLAQVTLRLPGVVRTLGWSALRRTLARRNQQDLLFVAFLSNFPWLFRRTAAVVFSKFRGFPQLDCVPDLVLGIHHEVGLVEEPVIVVVDIADHFRRLEQETLEVMNLLIDQQCLSSVVALT